MADTPKLLGQVSNALAEVALYTAPALTNTTVSSIVVCNRGATDTTFKIAVVDGAGSAAAEDWLFYDAPLRASDTFIATIGITLEPADQIRVVSGNANVTFNAFGIESA